MKLFRYVAPLAFLISLQTHAAPIAFPKDANLANTQLVVEKLVDAIQDQNANTLTVETLSSLHQRLLTLGYSPARPSLYLENTAFNPFNAGFDRKSASLVRYYSITDFFLYRLNDVPGNPTPETATLPATGTVYARIEYEKRGPFDASGVALIQRVQVTLKASYSQGGPRVRLADLRFVAQSIQVEESTSRLVLEGSGSSAGGPRR
jgi:hypothetical protein